MMLTMLLHLLQALFGDRYGDAAIRRSIPESQFHILMEISEIMKVKNAELLEDWYELDTNAVPACYSLKASACRKHPHLSSSCYFFMSVSIHMYLDLITAIDQRRF